MTMTSHDPMEWLSAEAEREYFDRYAPLATPGDAHREWHRNAGVPMGQPGCPQDACHPADDGYEGEPPTVKCGNRAAHGGEPGYHFSAAEVRSCYASTGRFESSGRRAGKTASQEATLAAQAEIARMREAQEVQERAERQAAAIRYAAWGRIPVATRGRAYYALERDGVTHFYRVERPTEGKWAGKTFVSEQAGDTFYKMPFGSAAPVLDAIAADPIAAGRLYGQQIGQCYRCHRTLTDPESRAAGIGPDCAKKEG